MSEKIQIGLVGTRGWAKDIHARFIQANPAAELKAICGRDEQRTAQAAHELGVAQYYTNYNQMIAHAGLDGIVICAPDDLHYPITLAALEQGLHVLCEKPLAHNVAEAREMRDRAVEAGVVHLAFFTFRWIPHYIKIKQLLEAGYIGRLLNCEFHFLAGTEDKQYAWQMDYRHGNGVLGDRGVHMIDLARWMVGELCRVNARIVTCLDWSPAPDGMIEPAGDDARLMLEFTNGVQGMIHASYVAYRADHGMDQRIVLNGDQGVLEVDIPLWGSRSSGCSLRGARYDEGLFHEIPISEDPAQQAVYRQHVTAFGYDVFGREMVADNLFIHSILNHRPATPDFTDGLKAQEVIAAAQESQRLGIWVNL